MANITYSIHIRLAFMNSSSRPAASCADVDKNIDGSWAAVSLKAHWSWLLLHGRPSGAHNNVSLNIHRTRRLNIEKPYRNSKLPCAPPVTSSITSSNDSFPPKPQLISFFFDQWMENYNDIADLRANRYVKRADIYWPSVSITGHARDWGHRLGVLHRYVNDGVLVWRGPYIWPQLRAL